MAHGEKTGRFSSPEANVFRSGFTLIEMVVVVGITALLSSILILYNHSSRQQVAFYTEETKFIQAAYRAKSLSLSLYNSPSSPDICGYGIHLDERSYYIFSYSKPSGSACRSIGSIDAGLKNQISVFALAPGVSFATPGSVARLSDVLFIPPNPTTLIKDASGNLIRNGSASIVIQTEDGSLSTVISVNSSGLVSFN